MKIIALIVLLVVACQAKRMSHQFLPMGQFSSLASGDIGGFIKKAALSQATGGLSDRLGLDSLMGGGGSSQGGFNLGNLFGSGSSGNQGGAFGGLSSLLGGQQQQQQPQQGGLLGSLGNLGNVGSMASGLFGGHHLKDMHNVQETDE